MNGSPSFPPSQGAVAPVGSGHENVSPTLGLLGPLGPFLPDAIEAVGGLHDRSRSSRVRSQRGAARCSRTRARSGASTRSRTGLTPPAESINSSSSAFLPRLISRSVGGGVSLSRHRSAAPPPAQPHRLDQVGLRLARRCRGRMRAAISEVVRSAPLTPGAACAVTTASAAAAPQWRPGAPVAGGRASSSLSSLRRAGAGRARARAAFTALALSEPTSRRARRHAGKSRAQGQLAEHRAEPTRTIPTAAASCTGERAGGRLRPEDPQRCSACCA
jgi:hypothetical protein